MENEQVSNSEGFRVVHDVPKELEIDEANKYLHTPRHSSMTTSPADQSPREPPFESKQLLPQQQASPSVMRFNALRSSFSTHNPSEIYVEMEKINFSQ